jgi:putative ABC transport system permease protein
MTLNSADMIQMGFSNLWRTRLRSILTIMGVIIGIGALTSMVSFGTGMQKNFTDAFRKSDLFTSMNITPKKINLNELSQGDLSGLGDLLDEDVKPLDDSLLQSIREIPGVEIAFPEETFPGRLQIGKNETTANIQPFPAIMGQYPPFNSLLGGKYYSDDTSRIIIMKWETLRNMGLVVEDPEVTLLLTNQDTLKGVRIVPADSLIGKQIKIITATINTDVLKNPLSILVNPKFEPFSETEITFTLGGILHRSDEFSLFRFRGGAFIPLETADSVPRLSFSSVWDMLNTDDREEGTYGSIYVRIKKMEDMTRVRQEIEKLGVAVFSISDQLKEMKRAFLIIDSLLGAIGAIALIIAGLGIINTMIMSILERTREIGIMKAVGGSEGQIRLIFFIEAGFIGLIGAIFGLGLGWLVTRIANLVMKSVLPPTDLPPVDLFYFPVWLLLGAIAFSVMVSLAAGLYPAVRAARIDPVKALRHD